MVVAAAAAATATAVNYKTGFTRAHYRVLIILKNLYTNKLLQLIRIMPGAALNKPRINKYDLVSEISPVYK